MASQPKIIKADKAKGKSSVKAQDAVTELAFLRNCNQDITSAKARTMQDISDRVCYYFQNHPGNTLLLFRMFQVWNKT